MRPPAPELVLDQRPRDVLDESGRWLADGLDGFRWVPSAQKLHGPVGGGQDLSIGLQGSTRSRAGAGTWVYVSLQVHDPRLRRWRTAHRDLALRSDDWLLLTNLGAVHRGPRRSSS